MSTPQNTNGSDNNPFFKGKTPRNIILWVGLLVAFCLASLGYYTMSKQQAKQQAEKEEKNKPNADFIKQKPDDGTHDSLDGEIASQEAKAKQDAARNQRPPQPNPTKPSFDGNVYGGGMNQQGGNGNQAEQDPVDHIYVAGIHRPGGMQINQQRGSGNDSSAADLSPEKLEARNAAAAAPGLTAQDVADLTSKMSGANNTGTGAAAAQTADMNFLANAQKSSQSGEGFSTATFVGQEKSCTLAPPSHIPVYTMEALNSDRPGTVSLVVSDDVYDSVTGYCLMIPKGSKINGPYSSDIRVGQERILVATTQLRLPNGKEVPLNGAQGADQDGAAGFSGDVNNHFLKIFGASFATAILLGVFDNSSTVSTTTSPYGVSQVGTTAGQVAAQTSQSILNRYQNIPPTITVPVGQRFMVKVNQDIHLEPYRD
jgi:type IV secretory pathway VirB10-like protein